MADNPIISDFDNNIRRLVYFFSLIIDHRVSESSKGTPYEGVRDQDIRVFAAASRKLETISSIARELHITRQSVQGSVRRLITLGVVKLKAVPGNRRDKHVIITESGLLARRVAARNIAKIEVDFAQQVGLANYRQLRETLQQLVTNNLSDVYVGGPKTD